MGSITTTLFILLCTGWGNPSLSSRLMVENTIRLGIEPAIDELKNSIQDQQSQISSLQQELAELLSEVTSGKEEFQKSQQAGPGANLEIHFPSPPPTSVPSKSQPPATPPMQYGSMPGPLEMQPIPVMVVKPDSVADVEEAMTQVLEEQAALTGSENAKSLEPQQMIVETPEEEVENAIKKIDELEAQKMQYKYDIRNVQNSFSQ